MTNSKSDKKKLLLEQARRLRSQVGQDMTKGDFQKDDLRMRSYNNLIKAVSEIFFDDPILNGGIVQMPDANIQMYDPRYGGLLPFQNMPPQLPLERLEAHLDCLIDRIEYVLDQESTEILESRTSPLINWSIIHPCIIKIAKKKFDDGYFADAVESAMKAVNKRVKDYTKSKTGKELDGAKLMNFAFSLDNPVIILDDLSTQTGRDVQVGYMQIFAGSMTGIRNPKAHDNMTIDEPQAIHRLFLASLLMSKLDEAKVP